MKRYNMHIEQHQDGWDARIVTDGEPDGEWVRWIDHDQAVGEPPQWRPAPEECPEEGWYWADNHPYKFAFLVVGSRVFRADFTERVGWADFYIPTLRIAGPLKPPGPDRP